MARATNLAEYRRSKVTIRDIAELAGVSIATVSRVINGRPDVAPETRDAVLRTFARTTSRRTAARAPSPGGTHRPHRPDDAHGPRRLLRRHPRRCDRGGLRAGHAGRPLHDAARARPRGLGARAPRGRRHRRLDHHAPGGVDRTSSRRSKRPATRSSSPIRACPSARTFRPSPPRTVPGPRRRPSTSLRSVIAASRTSAGRAGWAATVGAHRRLPRVARSGGRPAIGRLDRRGQLRGVAAAMRRALTFLDLPTPPTAIFALERQHGRRHAPAAHERGIACRTTSPSSASTTPSSHRT